MSSSAPVDAAVSRQPRLPQRQTAPSGSTRTWPELAGHAAPAAVEPPAEDQAGADARGDLEVDEVGGAAPGAVPELGERRRGWRRCRRSPGRRAGCAAPRRRRRRPSRAGSPRSRSRRRPGRPAPGSPSPTPITRERSTPASPSTSSIRSTATSRPSFAAWSVSSGSARSARIVDERSLTATRTWLWPKSIPSAAPADASNESRIGGRPPVLTVRRARLRALDDEAVRLQLGHEARDRGAREPGAARDLGAADHAVLAQRVDHAPPVEPAQRRQRAVGPAPSSVVILTRWRGALSSVRTNLHRIATLNVRGSEELCRAHARASDACAASAPRGRLLGRPPAMAGRMTSTSRSPTAVSRPSSTRTSSSLR